MKLACRTTEPYQPYVPHSYDNENDFGFGNMQVPEEENYDNEPPLLEGIYQMNTINNRIGYWFQSHIQEDYGSY